MVILPFRSFCVASGLMEQLKKILMSSFIYYNIKLLSVLDFKFLAFLVSCDILKR